MRILHTADWHIGQTLNGWTREAEHRAFLDHLCGVVQAEEVDALIVAGDVFDGINPSGDALRLLYAGLVGLLRCRPGLTVVLTAGNHDGAARFDAPAAALRELGIHLIGTLRRDGATVDMGHHLIPLRDAAGNLRAHVLAVPFLRAADLPGLTLAEAGTGEGAVVAATRALHARMADDAVARAGGLPVIAMGHLTCAGGLESEGAERRILIGGEHAVPPDIFPPAFCYVALGHLHRAQSLDGGRVRYSGSPFPLSASEIGYGHGVTLIDLSSAGVTHRHIALPRPVPCLRLPASGAAPLPEVEAALAAQGFDPATPRDLQPFVHLSLTPDRPAPALLAEAEAMLDRYPVRLASLRVDRPDIAAPKVPPPSLAETSPEDLFVAAFRQTHGLDPDARHLAAFRDVLAEV